MITLVLGVFHHLIDGGFAVEGVAVQHQRLDTAVGLVIQGKLLTTGAVQQAVGLGQGQTVT